MLGIAQGLLRLLRTKPPKLDIIAASKKSGFSIEDVMKYGLKKSTVYRLLAEKEKYTQQGLNTPSSNRVFIKNSI